MLQGGAFVPGLEDCRQEIYFLLLGAISTKTFTLVIIALQVLLH